MNSEWYSLSKNKTTWFYQTNSWSFSLWHDWECLTKNISWDTISIISRITNKKDLLL